MDKPFREAGGASLADYALRSDHVKVVIVRHEIGSSRRNNVYDDDNDVLPFALLPRSSICMHFLPLRARDRREPARLTVRAERHTTPHHTAPHLLLHHKAQDATVRGLAGCLLGQVAS